MKKIILTGIVTLLVAFSVNAQNVYIPDPVFKNFLINQYYSTNPTGNGTYVYLDSNNDKEIQYSEAATYSSNIYNHAFFLQGLNISDLTGIEAFKSIEWLNIPDNPLTSLNISGCLSLKRLTANYNNLFTSLTLTSPSLEILELSCPTLTSVNLSGCPALKNINCSNSPNLKSITINGCALLEELRVNNNPLLTSLTMGYHSELTFFQCIDGHLTSIDVSTCTSLEWLLCTGNPLSSLNLANGHPQSFKHIMATGFPDLTCIKVDNVSVSEFLWAGTYPYEFDEWASFSKDCSPAGPCIVTIPDANFKAKLLQNKAINTNGNTEIECAEAIAYTGTINVDNSDISNMTGIEAFINITALSCNDNNIWNFSSLNVSGFRSLKSVSCTGNNQFSSLNIKGCTALTSFTVNTGNNSGIDLAVNAGGCISLTGFNAVAWANLSLNLNGCTALASLELDNKYLNFLDVSNCSALTNLVCSNNHLSALNVNGCNALTLLNCSNNGITSLTVSNIPALTNLNCSYNELSSLNVLDNKLLSVLNCSNNHLPYLLVSNNPALTQLNFSHNNITYLDVNNNLNLTSLDCSYNSLSTQNVNSNIALVYFNCAYNNLNSQNVSLNTALTSLYCDHNNLKTIDVSHNTELKYFVCSYNQLPDLDLINNPALLQLDCSNNHLTNSDLSGNPLLSGLACNDNQLTELDLSNNSDLILLDCSNNLLIALNLSAQSRLYQIRCTHNQLTTLDVSNTHWLVLMCDNNQLKSLNLANGYNTIAVQISANNNKALECVKVDNTEYSTKNWIGIDYVFDTGIGFSQTCYALGINETANNQVFRVYPNPTKGAVYFLRQMNVQLYNVTGQMIAGRQNTNSLDLSNQPTGIYFITFTDNNGQVVQRNKIVKE